MSRPLKTGVGVVLTAIMLFPVYWMVNVSFTKDTDMRADPPHLHPGDARQQIVQLFFDRRRGTRKYVHVERDLAAVIFDQQ